ncbi:rhomboid family intramembrane serine protease [Leptospira sp. WS92.C1]
MKLYLTKLRQILPVFLSIYVLSLIGFLSLRWLLTIRYEAVDINEEIWNFVLPMAIPWLPVLIWLRPKLRILRFKNEDGNGPFFLQCISALTISVSLMTSQSYLTTAFGKLEIISEIQQLEKVPKARYYKLGNFFVDPSRAGVYSNFQVTGKYNENLNFKLFFGIPFLTGTQIPQNENPKYWYGIKFKKEISNRISDEEKEKQYSIFYNECIERINSYDYHSLDHFERTATSDDKIHFFKAIETRIPKKTDEDYIVLEPIQERFEDKNENTLAWLFGFFGIGFSLLLFSLVFPGIREDKRMEFPPGKKEDELIEVLKYLIPRGDHAIASFLLNLNLLVFLVMIFAGVHIFYPEGDQLLEWGANRRMETWGGQWWRLLTSMFVHSGILHLFLNGFGLVIAAIFVEPVLGRIRFLILYFLSGLCGSLASITWYSNTISIGASGAIFGLYGAILGLLLTDAFPKEDKKSVLTFIGTFIAINLVWGLFGGIDNAAHLGGLLSGMIFGIVLFLLGKRNTGTTDEFNRQPREGQ